MNSDSISKRFGALADDELGRAAANVDHQTPVTGCWQGIRRADEDQARFLATTDDLDGKAQSSLGLEQNHARISGHPHRVGGHRAHGFRIEAAQALAETPQGSIARCCEA
jgi:hypothetical protein